jgi:hypothetical protein
MTALAAVVRDVFRQAAASGLTATLLVFSALATLVCLSADYVPSANAGSLTVLFGSVTVIDGVPRDVAVRYLQFLLAAVVADTLGVLLALVWTAGFLPTFLDASHMSVLLAKPPRRTGLFLAKFGGVLFFVAVQAILFVGGTAMALGLRTGSWNMAYWLSVPILLLHFGVFYAFSALIAVMTRSTGGCLVGSILFWLACWAMNYGRHALAGLDVPQVTEAVVRAADVGYWTLPKPADFGLVLYDVLDADRFSTPWIEFRRMQERGLFHPIGSIISSLAFAAMLLAVAVYEFAHDDY